MFDVTTARVVRYGTDNALRAIVFQDRTQKDMWYLVPEPRLRQQNGQPAFSLTKYKANQGSAGVCTFEVELYTSEDALRAAERELGAVVWGAFTWISGDAFFEFDLPIDGKPTTQIVTHPPSLFGSNVAAFQIELADDVAVDAFKEAFSGSGALSPFRIRYDMGVLTQLLAGRATVTYVASAAIDYQRRYETRTDKWGNRSTVLAETTQLLKESGAGDVNVVFGPGVTSEVEQLVRDWAWATLEKQVATAVEAARTLAQGTDGPVSATSDFSATYSEDSTVEWSTPVSNFLPRFDAPTWEKLYREVDNRQLVVNFQLVGNPTEGGGFLYTDVEVEVDYPTRTTDNTFTLRPGTEDGVSYVYTAPGRSGGFDPNYKYRYKVSYPGGQPSFQSQWIEETATQINLRPDQFGIRIVNFVGLNVPFADKVETVLIDYYDNPPSGYEPRLQTKSIEQNGVVAQFKSTYHTLLTNSYTYRLRYVMKGGTVIVIEPGPAFGADNADVVNVMDPSSSTINFTVRAVVTGKAEGFASITVTADYRDPQNPPQPPLPAYTWDDWQPPETKGLYSADNWVFRADPSIQAARFHTSGQVMYGDGELQDLQDFVVAYRSKPLLLRDNEEVYSIEIISTQIDWTTVDNVQVNMFQLLDVEGTVASDRHAPTAAHLVPPHLRDARQQREAAQQTSGLLSYALFAPTDETRDIPLYYTLRKARSANQIVFYYNATYIFKDKNTPARSAEGRVVDRKQLVLPKEPQDQPPDHIHCVSLVPAGR